MRHTARLPVLALVTVGMALGLTELGVPSPALFAGLLTGMLHALLTGRELHPPPHLFTASQGVVGVVMGCLVQPATLAALVSYWLPVLLVTLSTLALTVLAGLLLARVTAVDRTTAAFGMIAGGASGIIALSDDLGADARIVAVLQYLRILVIVLLMPLAVAVVFAGGPAGAQEGAAPSGAWPLAVLTVAALVLVGTTLGRLVRLPAPGLLGPLLVTAPLAGLDLPFTDAVPGLLQSAAFAVLGAQVGLRFTAASLRTVRRILPVVLALVVTLVLANAGLGLLLSAATDITPLDGYLATTPGGLYVVLAVAAEAGADSTVVLSIQVLRLLVMLLLAPVLARWLLRS